MTTPVGPLLKYYRTKHNISQQEVAFSLGWHETSRLSRIESGKVGRPDQKLIEQIVSVMKLSSSERSEVMMGGSYLPSETDIKGIMQTTTSIIEQWPHPAFVYDYTWRIVTMNSQAKRVYKLDETMYGYIMTQHPWLVEVLFSPQFSQNTDLSGNDKKKWDAFLLNHLVRFRYTQEARTKEIWFTDLVSRMMDNELFHSMWVQSNKQQLQYGSANFGTVRSIIHPDDNKKHLSFHFTIMPFIDNPVFLIEYEIPADNETMEYFG